MTTAIKLLDRYQNAAEALLRSIFALSAEMHTDNRGQYERLRKIVDKCQEDLDQIRMEFEQGVPKDLALIGLKKAASGGEPGA